MRTWVDESSSSLSSSSCLLPCLTSVITCTRTLGSQALPSSLQKTVSLPLHPQLINRISLWLETLSCNPCLTPQASTCSSTPPPPPPLSPPATSAPTALTPSVRALSCLSPITSPLHSITHNITSHAQAKQRRTSHSSTCSATPAAAPTSPSSSSLMSSLATLRSRSLPPPSPPSLSHPHHHVCSFAHQTPHFPPHVIKRSRTFERLQIACNSAAVSWGIFTSNSQAAETKWLSEAECPVQVLVDLFEQQV